MLSRFFPLFVVAVLCSGLSLLIPYYTVAQYASLAEDTASVIQLPFERLTIKNGLSQGMVRSIIQDNKGYMWFSTKDGLNRYDGYNITVYRNDPRDTFSIPDNEVSILLEDPNGNLWVGTNTKGLCVFDRQTEKFYQVPTGNKSKDGSYEDLRSLQYRAGKLFVGFTLNVQILDVHRVVPGSYPESLRSIRLMYSTAYIRPGNMDVPFRFLLLDDRRVLISEVDSCFVLREQSDYRYTLERAYNAKRDHGGPGFLPEGAIMDEERHRCYLVSGYGSDDDIHTFDRMIGTDVQAAFRAFKDVTGKVWMLGKEGYQNMLYQFDPSTHSLKKIGSSNGEINQVLKSTISYCIDKSGIIWLGTGAYGVIRFDSRIGRFKNKALCSIYYLNFDKNGLLDYFPTGHRMDPATFDLRSGVVNSLLPAYLPRPHWAIGDVTSIVTDAHGNYWMVMCFDTRRSPGESSLCLFKYDPVAKRVTLHVKNDPLNGYAYKNIIQDNTGGLWILGSDYKKARVIIRYDEKKDTIAAVYRFPVAAGVDNYPFVSNWWQDEDGTFWFATREGLFRFNERTKEWKYYYNNPADARSLPTNKLLSLCPDPGHPGRYLWVGTEGAGLCRFDRNTGKCINYSEKDGLPNNVVYGILEDDNGHLWMSTNHGLSCFTPPASDSGGTFENFTKSDGIQDDEFNRFSFKRAPTGELVFGGVNGITWFKPDDVLKKGIAPTLVFTGLSVFNKAVSYRTDSSILRWPIDYATEITLPYDQNMFTISFASLEYSADDKKQYKYFLEGLDQQWINNGSKTEATYTNLDPGKYTFHVMAASRDGIWNGQDRAIRIVITPPWWATLWFRCIAVIVAVVMIYVLYRYRMDQALKVQQMRNRIASDLHDEIGSTLSSISLSSAVIQHRLNGGQDEVKGLLEQISSNTENMMEAMSDIVWSINTRNDRFDNITARMREFATGILEPLDCAFHLSIDQNTGHLRLDMQQRKNLYLIFKEAINNAAKYSGCKNVWVDIGMNGSKGLFMQIRDDGCGFSLLTSDVPVLVQGNGLLNMRDRAVSVRGSISIDTAPGMGTVLRLECRV